MNRADLKDQTFMKMALDLLALSTCRRRRVGCILVDPAYRIIASGVNGVPSGWVHCIDDPCPGAGFPTGKGLELCQSIHAEQNALMQCTRTDMVWTAYCTTSPCMHCVKMLSNTACTRIMFKEEYDKEAGKLWLAGRQKPVQFLGGRSWMQI